MKIKPTKICARKGCNNEFKIYKTTDKYCCPECAYLANKDKPKKAKKQYKLKPYSQKRKRESVIYSKKRKKFLEQPENKFCPVAKTVFNETRLATEVHHLAGRKGKLLNYVPYWLAVSRKGHNWIHDNPSEAYEIGFLIRPSTVNI
jgi:hypothetical protein